MKYSLPFSVFIIIIRCYGNDFIPSLFVLRLKASWISKDEDKMILLNEKYEMISPLMVVFFYQRFTQLHFFILFLLINFFLLS